MDLAAVQGHWVILQNVHLVKSWLTSLEKKLEQLSEDPHDDYRLFISAEPSADPHESIIPQVYRTLILSVYGYSEINKSFKKSTDEYHKLDVHCFQMKTILYREFWNLP